MKYLKEFILIFSFNLIISFSQDDKIIISLTSDFNDIQNTKYVINSIIEQNVEKQYYDILLILSSNEFKNINFLPKEIKLLHSKKRIKILFIKDDLSSQSLTLIAMKEYKNNPILIINNKCLLPKGWLKMFINDHQSYPSDAIAASLQYYFGKEGEIKEFSEGFKGKNFGTFNHVSRMIFNFALINKDLGGILYPKNFFHNISYYNQDLLFKAANNSEDFWQSAFIIMEDKVLRQSSKIFDYTKYLLKNINNNFYNINNKDIYENIKNSFCLSFPNLKDFIQKRQNKIIVSFTSYPKRFVFLPDLMNFIRDQNYHINKIKIFLYKEDMKYYNLNISDLELISVDKDLKPHKKYFYSMKLYRDYAIITIDDDLGYAKDTFESLFNAYIENPNIVSGRRGHLMTYKNNGESRRYTKWVFEQRSVKEPDFDLSLTNGAGTIFPPDILNINDDILPIIYETITCDDLTLKYFSVIRGIPHKWIINNNVIGVSRRLPKSGSRPLFAINNINNDMCINKLNIKINNTIIKDLCINYRNIPTGNSIYLFNIFNEYWQNNKLFFDVYAYSYCPIDLNLTFNIIFENHVAHCFFNKSKNLIDHNIIKENYSFIASCYSDDMAQDLDFYYFPIAISENILINIYHYKKYLTSIFKSFTCKEINNCLLDIIILEKLSIKSFDIMLNDKNYLCNIDEYFSFIEIGHFPSIKKFKCSPQEIIHNRNKQFISGIPKMINTTNTTNNNKIPNQFIISRVVNEKNEKQNNIIIIGHLVNNLFGDLEHLSISFLYPNLNLDCNLKSYSKYVQSKIYCNNYVEIQNEILIENQIVHSTINNEELILINQETFIRLSFNDANYLDFVFYKSKEKRNFAILKLYIFLLVLIFAVKSFRIINNYIPNNRKRKRYNLKKKIYMLRRRNKRKIYIEKKKRKILLVY